MANRYVRSTGGNWKTAGTWESASGAKDSVAVPTVLDDVFCDGQSGQVTINGTDCVAKSLTCTDVGTGAYANTMTFSSSQILTVSGDVTLSSTMATSGAGRLASAVGATAIWTSGGNTFSGIMEFSSGSAITFGNDWTCAGIFVVSTGSVTFDGYSVTCLSALTTRQVTISGTTKFILSGSTGINVNVSTPTTISNDIDIDRTGSIDLTPGFSVYYSTGTLTYISGTVTNTSGLHINGSCTLNLGAMTLSTLSVVSAATITLITPITLTSTLTLTGATTFSGPYDIKCDALACNAAATHTLSGNIHVFGNLTISGGAVVINGLFNVNIYGNLTLTAQPLSGTATIVLMGDSTWSASSAVGIVSNNVTINSTGTVTLSYGTTYYKTGTLTYVAGTMSTSSLDLRGGCTINMPNCPLDLVTFTTAGTYDIQNLYSITTISIPSSNTFTNFIIGGNPTINITAATTQTINGQFFIRASPLTGTSDHATISAAGAIDVFFCSITNINFTGGGTFTCYGGTSVSGNSGITFSALPYVKPTVYYLDYVNGIDSTVTPWGWWSVDYTGGSGTAPLAEETMTGATSLSTAKVTFVEVASGTWAGNDATGTIWFYAKSAPFVAEQINCAISGHCHIVSDFTYCAWKTFIYGATSSRVSNGDTIRIVKSSDPVSLGINGTWTKAPLTIPINYLAIQATTNTSPISVHIHTHDCVTGDCVHISGVSNNCTANGTWMITNTGVDDFTLDGSIGTAVSGVQGTCAKINHHCVKLASACTKTVTRCEGTWTSANSSTVSANSSYQREGYYSAKIVKSSPAINTLYAYFATGEIDLSSYQALSFSILVDTAVASMYNWRICLCSDVAGAVPIDTFEIPVFPATSAWIPLTLSKKRWSVSFTGGTAPEPVKGEVATGGTSKATAYVDSITVSSGSWVGNDAVGTMYFYGKSVFEFQSEQVNLSGGGHIHITSELTLNNGGNLHSAVKSIAFYSGEMNVTTAGIYIDNVIACTTSGLNLQSLISKESLAKDGTEGFYGIQSISENGLVVRLDLNSTTNARFTTLSRGVGYAGTDQTTTCYIRETIKTVMTSSTSSAVQPISAGSGAYNLLKYYEGGYDPVTNTQTGETLYDGLTGYGYGLYVNSIVFNSIKYLSFFRYYYGIHVNTSRNCIISNIGNSNNNTKYGLALITSHNNLISYVRNLCDNGDASLYINGSFNNSISNIGNLDSSSYGIYIENGNNNTILSLSSATNNLNYGVSFITSSNNYLYNATMDRNTYAVANDKLINYLRNCVLSGGTEFVGATSYANSRIYSDKHNGTANNHYIYTDGGAIESASGATYGHTASGICWKLSPTSTDRNSSYPLRLSLARVACNSGSLVTVTAWFKVTNTTDIRGELLCRSSQLSGITEDKIDPTNNVDTNYEQLSISFTPTEAGVVEIEGLAWWLAGAADESVYIDDITVQQA